jgi:hypothetical protein
MITESLIANQASLQKMLSFSIKASFGDMVAKYGFTTTDKALTKAEEQFISRVMFTVAGMQFRAMVLLHYHTGKQAVQFLNILQGNETSANTEADVEPYFTEMGNQFCGEIKRHFYKQFEHLGMSIPSVMSQATTLDDLRSNHLISESHEFYLSNKEAVLGGSIYVFAREQIQFEYASVGDSEAVSSGELEFF